MPATEPEFSFDGREVGYFVGGNGHRTAGSYRYEPYRGSGHYEMQTLLRAGGTPRCSNATEDELVRFTVGGCPRYGVLDLRDFECRPHEPS